MDLKIFINDFIKRKVKEDNSGYCREPLIGYSSSDDILYTELKTIVGNHHLHPSDILENVQTVISFFIPFTSMVVNNNRKIKDVSDMWIDTYKKVNILINEISNELVEDIKKLNIDAATLPATAHFDTVKLVADWSHRSAAYIAGLGSFGINNMLITEKGGAGRYGTIFISEKLAPTKRNNIEHCLYLKDKSCTYCIDKCPVNALTPDNFNRKKCYEYLVKIDHQYEGDDKSQACGKCAVGPCAFKGS